MFHTRFAVPLALALQLFLLVGCVPQTTMPSMQGEFATLLPDSDPMAAPGDPPPNAATDSAPETENLVGLVQDRVIPTPAEHPVTLLPLESTVSAANLEFSSMAWHGDQLILLPQYPSRFSDQAFALDRGQILAYLNGEEKDALVPSPIRVDDGRLATMVPGFEGYEAIAFDGDRAYLTVETQPGSHMLGYLLTGTMSADGSVLAIEAPQRVPLPAQSAIDNLTDETLIIDGDRVLTFYEANGIDVNRAPIINVHSRDLERLEPLPLPNIEYRITDATAVDEASRFWAINYFFPGDTNLLPDSDPLAEQYGTGVTHQVNEQVERLLEFQIEGETVRLTDSPPIQLDLSPSGPPRNWEGIVRLQEDNLDGFLLVTDRFPTTLLAFVER